VRSPFAEENKKRGPHLGEKKKKKTSSFLERGQKKARLPAAKEGRRHARKGDKVPTYLTSRVERRTFT